MPTRAVERNYVAQYSNPLAASAGQTVVRHREDDEYPGWVWCSAPDGREGWIPAEYLECSGTLAALKRDYDAGELTVQSGDLLTILDECAGWVRAVAVDGR